MIGYLDTSAALKLVIEEPESSPLAAHLARRYGSSDHLVSSMLLHTELHCASQRRGISSHLVVAVLNAVTIVDLDRSDLLRAAAFASGLRSADAIHLAVALRLEADDFITYDRELITAADRTGMLPQHPGTS